MTIETLNDVKASVYSDIDNHISNMTIDCSYSKEDIANEIERELDSYPPEVIYYHEAWSIVAGSSFNDFEPEHLDFSDCESALDCVTREAQALIDAAYYSVLHECIQETAEEIADIIDAALEIGADESEYLSITSGSSHGWAAHNRETESGIAIYDDKPGFYNPAKLEGELYAVEGSVLESYVSVCWNPSECEEC